MQRCSWVDLNDEMYIAYHDTEWGIPVHDERLLFEMLVLESFQAGLSWQCVLHKRHAFKVAFDDFNVKTVAKYDEKKVASLVQNAGIIRHVGKIRATIDNARVFIEIQKEFGAFDTYLWNWTRGKIIQSDGTETTSDLSDAVSKDLRKRGMKFVGSTTIFSYLCAVGVIYAHQPECELYHKVD